MVAVLVISVCFAVVISATCSVFEAVLYSISTPQVELLAKHHPHQAKGLLEMKENIEQPITAILTLNTIANTIGAAVAGAAAVAVFGAGSLVWFSLLFTLAILMFSEILPKTVGVVYNRSLAPMIVSPLKAMIFTLRPIIWLCRALTRLVPHGNRSELVSAEELKTIVSLSRKSGQIEKDQELVIGNILQLDKKTVRKVMTPRTVTFSVDKSLTIREATAQDKEGWKMHSRVPVYEGDPDNVVGLVLSQDVLVAVALGQDSLPLARLTRPVHFVPETAPLDRVFIDFFENHQHLMVAVDEYGSVTGVISLEDIIEEIIGREIVDESDKNKNMRQLARLRKQKNSQPDTD
ncbi:MAG: hypothetical protein CSA33_07695 [Desulfobulbus propionicus]|nr:MAG: hypothetical protein CSA33_07695 [Desulfobulbus propionicus]